MGKPTNMSGYATGKVAVVTGASSGMGKGPTKNIVNFFQEGKNRITNTYFTSKIDFKCFCIQNQIPPKV